MFHWYNDILMCAFGKDIMSIKGCGYNRKDI